MISLIEDTTWRYDGRVDVSVVDEVADDLEHLLLGRGGKLLGERVVQHLKRSFGDPKSVIKIIKRSIYGKN